MSAVEKLRRPSKDASREERVQFVCDIRAALDRLQVASGEEFLIASHNRVSQPRLTDDPADPALGGFRATDPGTSRKAAIAVAPRTGTQRATILQSIAGAGSAGADAYQVQGDIGGSRHAACKRISELKQGEWIEVVDEREGDAGTPVSVYAATEKGRQWVLEQAG